LPILDRPSGFASQLTSTPAGPRGKAPSPTAAPNQQNAWYPLPAFYFKVITGLRLGADTSFQEVRGIGSEIETEEVVEGGENRFVHRLPKAVKHPQLELKRAGLPPGWLVPVRSRIRPQFSH
jgi:hypothetical protein